MSIVGILSSNLFSAGAPQTTPSSQGTPSAFQKIKTEFQQLGQDLQSGNLKQAQSDFTTLSQNLSAANQTSAATANPASSGHTTIAQAFSQLGQDLQAGNLQGAPQDFTNLQQNVQQASGQQVGGHHHHHTENSPDSSSQQTNPLVQAFATVAQDLQAGNLSGAQSAFSALQNDLQQIGGFLPAGSNGASSTAVPATAGSLNVTA
jgi:hypothetical protein